ncbi:two-component system response regulator [Streptomyces melanogenes]|uniref:two-component system response regulator n=1 Tax=Streptomyces melanogenes TaxID=67326 RepID=UPI003788DA7B
MPVPPPSSRVPGAGSPPGPGQALLLVDDHEDNLFALEHALTPLGRPVLRATSGEQALKTVLREPVATVVMDVVMPHIDGLQTLDYLHRLDQTRDLPVLLVTGTSRDNQLAQLAYKLGAAGILLKPLDPWALCCHVRTLADLYTRTPPTA